MDSQENKQNVGPGTTQPATSSETQAAENSGQGSQVPEDYTYFNVMPHGKGSGETVSPTVHIQDIRKVPEQSTGTTNNVTSYKYYILGLIVVALGVAAYFLIPVFFAPDPSENVLVNTANTETQGQTDTNTPNEVELTREWLVKYFNVESCVQENMCGTVADPDLDGYQNLEEFRANTDPNNNDSDKDGLADGDEVKIFGSDPLNERTSGNAKYTDADYMKGGYDLMAQDQLLTKEQLAELSKKMKEIGLHQPTLTTLGPSLETIYSFKAEAASATEGATEEKEDKEDQSDEKTLEGVDQSPEAKQDRDAQRYNTTKTIAIALQKYYEDQNVYPNTGNFKDMVVEIKPYNRIATNPMDPIDKEPYVYAYKAENNGADFSLSYYSETQNQVIRLRAKDAQKFKESEEAKVNDDRRMSDLQLIQSALQVYSNANIAGNQEYVFPTEDKYKTALVPAYMTSIPKDPQTGKDYEYKVSENFDSFTLKAVLSNPPTGTTGYMCNQEECRNY